MSSNACVYKNCKKSKKSHPGICFFKFPVKDGERAEEWKKNSGNIKIASKPMDSLSNRLVCELHFLPSDFIMNAKRKILLKSAIPTIPTLGSHSTTEPTAGSTKLQNKAQQIQTDTMIQRAELHPQQVSLKRTNPSNTGIGAPPPKKQLTSCRIRTIESSAVRDKVELVPESKSEMEICRTCLDRVPSHTCKSIFNDDIRNIVTMISNIELIQGDGLPPNICDKCFDQVVAVMQFKIRIESSDATLKKPIIKRIKIEENYVMQDDPISTDIDQNVQIKEELVIEDEDIELKFEPSSPIVVKFEEQELTSENFDVDISSIKKECDDFLKFAEETEISTNTASDYVNENTDGIKFEIEEQIMEENLDGNYTKEKENFEEEKNVSENLDIDYIQKEGETDVDWDDVKFDLDLEEESSMSSESGEDLSNVVDNPVSKTNESKELSDPPDDDITKSITSTLSDKALQYRQFMDWISEKSINAITEQVVIDFFKEKANTCTKWKIYSMLRSTIKAKHNLDLATYTKLSEYLKGSSADTLPKTKKTKIFTAEEIGKFLSDAPDDIYLDTKVALIVGVMGGCHKHELWQMKIDHIEDTGDSIMIKVPDTKTKSERCFAIGGRFRLIFKKYWSLRPTDMETRNFFLNYQNGRCYRHVLGINKFELMAKQVAAFLKLENRSEYTSECLRRMSGTLILDDGTSTDVRM